MRKQMIENAAFEVATQIRAVEELIDATLAEIAELQSRMMRVNSVAHVGPAPIHGALEEALLRASQPGRGAGVDRRLPCPPRRGQGQGPGSSHHVVGRQ